MFTIKPGDLVTRFALDPSAVGSGSGNWFVSPGPVLQDAAPKTLFQLPTSALNIQLLATPDKLVVQTHDGVIAINPANSIDENISNGLVVER